MYGKARQADECMEGKKVFNSLSLHLLLFGYLLATSRAKKRKKYGCARAKKVSCGRDKGGNYILKAQ